MANKATTGAGDGAGSMTNYLFWTLLLQGAWAILFGVLILIFPATLFIFVAATCFWIGLTLAMLAFRIRKFKDDMTEIYKEAY
ncbi:MAG TPA: hypothetical protein VMR98_04495 [Candidatus Polarisedimenticolaceae bacterium]|nr:hypothetical protein [Candidatus Polarisedimenticolaceae bacterium]